MKEKNGTPARAAERLASLCRLALSDEEKTALADDLTDMIAFADALLALDTDGVCEDGKRKEQPCILRKDTAAASLQRERLLEASPSVADGYITVPRILGEETSDA